MFSREEIRGSVPDRMCSRLPSYAKESQSCIDASYRALFSGVYLTSTARLPYMDSESLTSSRSRSAAQRDASPLGSRSAAQRDASPLVKPNSPPWNHPNTRNGGGDTA